MSTRRHVDHYPNFTDAEGPVVVLHNGEPASEVLPNGGAAFHWLLRHHPQSVSYALTYEGYSVVPAPATKET